jgi:squalene-hopene/tetraprenyl-beta-curcumene cyclase
MLCRAAILLAGAKDRHAALDKAAAYLDARCGIGPEKHAEAIRARYGKDRTFSVPILMTSALAGLVSWKEVSRLPFELACLPQSWFRFLKLHVVSYALPALIAIGQAVHHHRPSWNPLARLARWLAKRPSLRVLQRIQPSSGGFLEATPLTSFVTMALASIGEHDHPVVRKGLDFLRQSVRPDGSWPIDSNLSIWVTTLSVNALAAAGELGTLDRKEELLAWLLAQQVKEQHPYTGAAPGGWGWSHLSGSVPDADDTPGALLAIRHLAEACGGHSEKVREALQAGERWLLDLQNADGGWPTFCRGWGRLPFDRSGADLTAHAVRALADGEEQEAIEGGFAYLAQTQRADGSWLPLWFGNERGPDDENPTYGTARVLGAYRDWSGMWLGPARRGLAWLLAAQNADGSWGGGPGIPGSIEETALAVDALLDGEPACDNGLSNAMNRGLAWLCAAIEQGRLKDPHPIGFYFAKLWYFEKLYPVAFAVAALGRARSGAGSGG